MPMHMFLELGRRSKPTETEQLTTLELGVVSQEVDLTLVN